jgi:hypothetical protein
MNGAMAEEGDIPLGDALFVVAAFLASAAAALAASAGSEKTSV